MNKKLIMWVVVGAVVAGAMFSLVTPAPAVKKGITSQELTQLQASGAWVVDVRTNSEFIGGHIANSLNVPVDELPQIAAGWSKTQPVIVYCATGARSAQAASYLAAQGFKKVYDLSNGIVAWTGQVEGGQPTASTPSGPAVVKTSGKPVFIDFAGSA
jgi:rhodanese-related sulfurtransferase